MKTLYFTIIASVFFMLFLTNHVYATCDMVNGKQTCFGMEPILISIHSDKSHYENSDKPVITITGMPNKLEYLEIHNQSGNVVFSQSIELPPTGVVNYVLDISSYKLGVYSAIASTSTSNVTTHFMVGPPSGPPMTLNVVKNTYAPGDTIKVLGTEGPNGIIQLSLLDPNSNVVKSVQTYTDNAGQFSSNDLKIPTNAISGIWQINATHGISYTSLEIKVNSSSTIASVIPSPLKQFQSGIKTENVKCNPDLILAIKLDYSPACVKESSATSLFLRGWTFGFANYQPVYFMKSNTVGQISVKYYPNKYQGGVAPDMSASLHSWIYDMKSDSGLTLSDIHATAKPDYIHTNSITIVNYTIAAGSTQGVYWLSLLDPCTLIPIAVDLDESHITTSDLQNPAESKSCPAPVTQFHVMDISNVILKLIHE
ncbi:MAG: hypothetical protein PXX83_09540 [Candidatus Nitrosotalea sp.]|nr:hypothetical protein [Candidatus Nitrosotalea sp.]